MSDGERRGHLLALFTIMVWGTTFLSTSVLLRDFTPLEILIIRMALGIAALTVARPRRLCLKSRRHEWLLSLIHISRWPYFNLEVAAPCARAKS